MSVRTSPTESYRDNSETTEPGFGLRTIVDDPPCVPADQRWTLEAPPGYDKLIAACGDGRATGTLGGHDSLCDDSFDTVRDAVSDTVPDCGPMAALSRFSTPAPRASPRPPFGVEEAERVSPEPLRFVLLLVVSAVLSIALGTTAGLLLRAL